MLRWEKPIAEPPYSPFWRERKGGQADSSINNNVADGTYWYRIARNGGNITVSYSGDGSQYAAALSADLTDPANPFNELILTATTFETANSFTVYDHVNIASTSSAPEPGGFTLMALGAACIGLGRFRRKICAGRLHR